MSLQELPGFTTHLKLSIKEGHGFGFLKSPIVIVAGINRIYLETEVVLPSPDPLFHIDLVWETDKRNLRRFRASNTPIKLECFTISGGQRECIGSVLLNIKSAQVIAASSHKNVIEKWHRLIGIPPEAKALQPEILLSLTIQEPNSLSQPLSGSTWETSKKAMTQSEGSTSLDLGSLPSMLPTLQPQVEYKQGYIQLGPENSCFDTFLLHLLVKKAFELGLLLCCECDTSNIDFSVKPFEVSVSFMGQTMKTGGFGELNWEKNCIVNKEVVLPIRSSLSTFNIFLQSNPCATICFLYNGQEIAASELHLRSLVPTNDVQSFSCEFGGEFSMAQKCILVRSNSGSVPSHPALPPCIEVAARLQLTNSLTLLQNPPLPKTSYVINRPKANEEPCSRSESRQSQDTFIVTSQSGPMWVPVAPGTVQSHTFYTSTGQENYDIHTTTVRVAPYCLDLFQSPKVQSIRFLFECSNSLKIISKCPDISLPQDSDSISIGGVYAKISFQSSCIIQIHIFSESTDSVKSQYFATASVTIQALSLREQKDLLVACDLMSTSTDQRLGLLNLSLVLEEENCRDFSSTQRNVICADSVSRNVAELPVMAMQSSGDHATETISQPSPTRLLNTRIANLSHTFVDRNESFVTPINKEENALKFSSSSMIHKIHTAPSSGAQSLTTTGTPLTGAAYKIVEELEDWKDRQQDIFLAELKLKEKDHIAKITEEWTAQTRAQTSELDKKMEECKLLTQSLSKAKQDLQERLKLCAVREHELKRKKDELEQQYNLKFQELMLAAKRLDEGVKLKVALVESKCVKLEEKIKDLVNENSTLHSKLQAKISIDSYDSNKQMCGMSHNQVSVLLAQVDRLEENLRSSLKSKAYFKEQWGRAVRKMNQAKLNLPQTSNNSECLENILVQEEKELQHDQRTLEKIRQEIITLNP